MNCRTTCKMNILYKTAIAMSIFAVICTIIAIAANTPVILAFFPYETKCTNSDIFTYEGLSFDCANDVCYKYNGTYISYTTRWNECAKRNALYVNSVSANEKLYGIRSINNTVCYYYYFDKCYWVTYTKNIGFSAYWSIIILNLNLVGMPWFFVFITILCGCISEKCMKK